MPSSKKPPQNKPEPATEPVTKPARGRRGKDAKPTEPEAAPATTATPADSQPWKLRLAEINVDLIDLDPNNVNEHNDDSLKAVEESLSAFGQQKPIVVMPTGDRYIVIAGNATLRKAKELQWPQISCVVSTLTGDDATAYAITDNRTTRLSTWNYKLLQAQLRELHAKGYHMPKTGWFGGELGNMVNTSWTPPTPPAGSGEGAADEAEDDEDDKEIVTSTLQFTAEEWVLLQTLKTRLGCATEKGAVLMLTQKALGPGEPA